MDPDGFRRWLFVKTTQPLVVIMDTLLLEGMEKTVSWNYHSGLAKGGFEGIQPQESDRENSTFVSLIPFIFTVWWEDPVAACMTDTLSL